MLLIQSRQRMRVVLSERGRCRRSADNGFCRRSKGRPRASSDAFSGETSNATASTIAGVQKGVPAQGQARTCHPGHSGSHERASSTRPARCRDGRPPHNHTPNRSGYGGRSFRRSRKASVGRILSVPSQINGRASYEIPPASSGSGRTAALACSRVSHTSRPTPQCFSPRSDRDSQPPHRRSASWRRDEPCSPSPASNSACLRSVPLAPRRQPSA